MPKPASKSVPEGMNTITTQLWFDRDCAKAIELYRKAFGAEVAGDVAYGPDGKSVMHVMMKIGNSHVMMADAWPGAWEKAPAGSATAGLFVYVDDCDRLVDRAVKAGCEPLFPVADMFWGDRMGKIKDPFGHCWAIATHRFEMTPEEMQQGQKEWLASMKK
jgi:PhnB protein